MMRKLQKLKEFDLQDVLVLIAALGLIVGLALIYLPAALIIPSALVLTLGYFRKWY